MTTHGSCSLWTAVGDAMICRVITEPYFCRACLVYGCESEMLADSHSICVTDGSVFGTFSTAIDLSFNQVLKQNRHQHSRSDVCVIVALTTTS